MIFWFLENSFFPPSISRTGRLPTTMEEAATDLQIRMEGMVMNDEGLHKQASQAYVSFIR